ncbi:MAG TPA: putative quinol monooxygenase [Candidatus Cybelea sp.]|nr:putative quinol monooxygenase [Candidatus Cybelea sp.]
MKREDAVLAIVATIKVKPGSEKDFEAVAKELVAKVNANEPGCKLYTLCKGEDPQTYVFMERYEDKAATELHRSTDYFKDLGRKMGPYMAGPPVVQRMVEV